MRGKLGALTKSGKTLGVRSFYKLLVSRYVEDKITDSDTVIVQYKRSGMLVSFFNKPGQC